MGTEKLIEIIQLNICFNINDHSSATGNSFECPLHAMLVAALINPHKVWIYRTINDDDDDSFLSNC